MTKTALLCLSLLLAAQPLPARGDASATGRAWAVHLDEPGLPNFARVNDHLYRGAQPTAEGFKQLEKLGIRTVVSFRRYHDDKEQLAGAGMEYIRIPMTAAMPDINDIAEFLKIAADTNRWPIFIHCQHGADRTGLQAAACRVAIEGWSPDEAVDEMTHGGFGFHSIYLNLSRLVRRLDVADLRARAGLAAPAPPLRILALGDSYTIGEGVAVGARWPNQFAELLRARGRAARPPQIIAATGWTTMDLRRAMSRANLAPPYDIVTLLIGVNDQYQSRGADFYREGFAGLLTDAISLAGDNPGRVIVLSIPDYSLTPFAARMDTDRIRKQLETFNTINRNAAQKAGVRYVDLALSAKELAEHPDLLSSDGLHPSARLYEDWARRALEVMDAARVGP